MKPSRDSLGRRPGNATGGLGQDVTLLAPNAEWKETKAIVGGDFTGDGKADRLSLWNNGRLALQDRNGTGAGARRATSSHRNRFRATNGRPRSAFPGCGRPLLVRGLPAPARAHGPHPLNRQRPSTREAVEEMPPELPLWTCPPPEAVDYNSGEGVRRERGPAATGQEVMPCTRATNVPRNRRGRREQACSGRLPCPGARAGGR
ncbi:hypothetical protein [Streptomyces sp. TLI_146]|uniref:hypothetical protein n=1 Tax=Streptomyces sp. TLI_146 TaxID=1938858 RepID=UPI0015D58BF8|nr:hypothetical protein [Streptomyces sp. TLI_146]